MPFFATHVMKILHIYAILMVFINVSPFYSIYFQGYNYSRILSWLRVPQINPKEIFLAEMVGYFNYKYYDLINIVHGIKR